jgi:signal transduction histidine kinase
LTATPAAEHADYVVGVRSLLKLVMLDIGLSLDAYWAQSTENLRTALELYSQSNTELREFAHLASHDLKTPLATVSGLCEEFLDEFGPSVPAEGRQLIETARNRALNMKRMIDELLQASEAAAQPSQRAMVSLRALLDEVLARVRLELGELGQRPIRFEVPNGLPEVYAHPGRLREVLYHVISNAVKFMDKEPGLVRVSASSANGQHIICIADNGPGMAESELSKIFAPFQRLSRHRHLPGSGLGLYFVRKMVEEQGGKVWVESRLGEGSRFYLALPAGEPAPGARRSL